MTEIQLWYHYLVLDILAQKNPNVSSLVVAERPNTDTVPHSMHYCGKLPKNYKLATFWGRVKKAGVCVKLWLAGIYFLVHAIFVAWKLWIWQQVTFLACQLWQLLLYFIVTVCLARWHSTLYLYIFACFSLYCCYMLTNSFKALFFASIIIEILSRITLFLCQILSP